MYNIRNVNQHLCILFAFWNLLTGIEFIPFLKWNMNGHVPMHYAGLVQSYDCIYACTTSGISNVCSKVNVVVKDY